MATKKKTTEDEEDVDKSEGVKETEATTPKKGEVTKIIFHVRSHNHANGFTVREFTKAEQGEDFVELANQFADTNAGHIISRKDE